MLFSSPLFRLEGRNWQHFSSSPSNLYFIFGIHTSVIFIPSDFTCVSISTTFPCVFVSYYFIILQLSIHKSPIFRIRKAHRTISITDTTQIIIFITILLFLMTASSLLPDICFHLRCTRTMLSTNIRRFFRCRRQCLLLFGRIILNFKKDSTPECFV